MKSKSESMLLHLEDISALPSLLALSSQHFTAFLAADFTNIESATIAALGERLVSAGCVYFCIWGPDCEQAHDIIDEVCFDVEPAILTTWHSKETLDEALWFFAFNAIPDNGYKDTTASALAISIGNTAWQESIKRRLTNLEELNHDIVNGA